MESEITPETVLAQVESEFCRLKCEKLGNCAARFAEMANAKGYTEEQAREGFKPHIDPNCKGYKMPTTKVCGANKGEHDEGDCGHARGPSYLPLTAYDFVKETELISGDNSSSRVNHNITP